MHYFFLFLYKIGICCYYWAIMLVAFFRPKAKKWLVGRQNLLKTIQADFSQKNNRSFNKIWVHCASLGEFEQARPLIESIKTKNKNNEIILTFFSPSGYEIRKNYSYADYVYYLPLDTKRNAQIFLQTIEPQMAIFIKYEFWYHYLTELHQKQIPCFLVSAIFRPKQIFFRWHGIFFRSMLRNFTHLFVQNESSKKLLQQIAIKNVSVAKDTRFDRVWENSLQAKSLPIIERFQNNKPLFVAGSTWPADERLLIQFINQNKNNLCFVLAPHEIVEKQLQQLETMLDCATIRYSACKKNTSHHSEVLLIDNIGILSSIYQYADWVYIGGGFGKGIHNILEAAVFGVPIFFGTRYQKFQEAIDLVAQQGAFSIKNAIDISKKYQLLQKNPTLYQQISQTNYNYIQQNRGATELILKHLENCRLLTVD